MLIIFLTFFVTFHNIHFLFATECGLVLYIPKEDEDENQKYSQSPWNVAVYDDLDREHMKEICSGTIITEYLVISAANCLFDRSVGEFRRLISYEIVLSKATRDYHIKDNRDMQSYRIREFYSLNSYQDWSHENDIIILETGKKMAFKPTITPACMQWNPNEQYKPKDGEFGKIISWRAFSKDESVHEIDVSYLSFASCYQIIPDKYKTFITPDKFCANNITDNTVGPGDAGAGFMFLRDGRYYLFGILTIRIRVEDILVAVFTDISYHLDWIVKIHLNVQKRLEISKQEVQNRTQKFASTSSEPSTVINSIVVNNNCQLPFNVPGRRYHIHCNDGNSCHTKPGAFVPQFTSLTILCEDQYIYDNVDSTAVCFGSVWKPLIGNCSKLCKKLHPVNVELKCIYDGREVNCNSRLKSGTLVYPKCFPTYIPQGGDAGYREMLCQEDGEWSEGLFKCIPDCGIPYIQGVTLIKGGINATYGDFPWHVAIYKISSHTLICGGTIITPNLIVSAAHCFFDEMKNTPKKANEFEIMVSKVTRDYFVKDNEDTQAYKVKIIYFESKGYHGLLTHYANDIALLETTDKIILKPTVRTVCLQWTRYDRFTPREGTIGKVAGWGIDDSENPNGSYTLLATELPYISYQNCTEIAPSIFKQYVTLDKFCAGNITGASVTQGDSGGGLVFHIRSLFYLGGVVSTKINKRSSLAAFTDISEHIEWIIHVKNQIEKRLHQ